MNTLQSKNKPKINQSTLKLHFLIHKSPIASSSSQPTDFHPLEKYTPIEQKMQIFDNIRTMDFFNCQYHYLKSIQSEFDDVEATSYMICPPLISMQWQIQTATKDISKSKQNQSNVQQYKFPIFLSNKNLEEYLNNSQCELIGLIIKNENTCDIFLGYLPSNYRIMDVVHAYLQFLGIQLNEQSAYSTQLNSQIFKLTQLQNATVKQRANNYLKIIIKPVLQINYEQYIYNETQIYNVQNLETNFVANSIFGGSQMEIETCFQQEMRRNLINIKNSQEIQKIKNKCKIIIQNNQISIPIQNQKDMEFRLTSICQQIQKMIQQ